MNKNAYLFLAAGFLVLVGLFFFFKPPERTTIETPPTDSSAVASVPPTPARVHEWAVQEGRRVSGPEVLALRQGDEARLRITSDRDDELHVHGYDLHLELKAGVPAELSFKAERSGRFEIELHRAHLELGALEVQPR